jgi:hypothetical protein
MNNEDFYKLMGKLESVNRVAAKTNHIASISTDPKVFTKLKLLSDGVPAEFFSTTNGKTSLEFGCLMSPALTKDVGEVVKIAAAMGVTTLNDGKDSVMIGGLGFADTAEELDIWNPQKMADMANNQPPMRIEYALIAPNKVYNTKSQLRISFAYARGNSSAQWYRTYLINLFWYFDKLGINAKIAENL